MTKNRRRAKGTGSVYTRKDGRVVGEYEVNGRTKYIYGRDEDTVREKLAAAIRDRDAGFDAENLTTAEYLDRWMAATKDTVRIGTWKQYEQITRLHLKPTIGAAKLDKLNALQIQQMYRSKLDAGVSARRVQYIHVTIHKALRDAVKWRLVPYNVVEACIPPKPAKGEIQPFNATQVKCLLAAARETQPRFHALYVLACTTGMRQGELLGLQRGDLDLVAGTVTIRRSIFNGIVSPPKSANGKRSIKLSKLAADALERHLQHHAGDSWVFSTRNGTPINATNFYHQSWRPLLKAANLPHRRFHDLRHTAATLMLQQNVNPKIVSNILGHGDVAFTLTTYSHVVSWMQGPAADGMDDLLG